MDQLRLHFLGGISLVQGDKEHVGKLPSKALALMCYLAVTGEAQNRGALSSLLWSDFPEHRARGNLRDTLTILRKTSLAPYLNIGRQVISFNRDLPYWLDTDEFQTGVQQGAKGLPYNPADLETAVALYRGEFVAGFQLQRASLFEEWGTIQRQTMHLLVVEALHKLVEYHLDAGSYTAGIPQANRLFTLDPWREETHRNLMLLLFLNGETNAALNQYEQCRQILFDEIGVAPSEETQTLYRNIGKQIDRQAKKGASRLTPRTSFPTRSKTHNIPSQGTRFIGREKEQRAIDIVLGEPSARLVTIFGVGGSGKTRLALVIGEKQLHAIARDGERRFADGVFFVPLEAVEVSPELVPAICHALSFQPADEHRSGRSIEAQLLDYLRHKRLLLIIDNFEHLLDRVGLLGKIVRTAPNVHLLVTSRQKLGLQSERLYALEGLQYPEIIAKEMTAEALLADYSAAALFAASARRAKSDFQLHDEEVPTLIRLCHLVDGLPLALELAAGWTNVLSMNDITAEIEQGLSFLESDLHDLPTRHRSMEAVFDVTWRRLPAEEQAIFAQLCVFRGGFNRQAAAQVVGANLRQLAALANKGLVQYDRELDRYQIHRLLHQFGVDKLAHDPGAEKRIRDRHSSYYCAALQQWNIQLKGTEQLNTLAILDIERANSRSAWSYAAETGQFDKLDLGADGLNRFYLWRRRFHEGEATNRLVGETLFEALSALEGKEEILESKRILAKIQIWQSVFCEQEQASGLIDSTLKILESPELAAVDSRFERAFGMQRAGDLAFDNNGQEARHYYERSLALYQELNNPWETAKIFTALGWLAAHNGKIGAARQMGEEALVRAGGDCKRTADVLWLLGTLAILEGDVEESTRLLGESLDMRETLGDRTTDIAAGPLDLGMTLTWIGRMAEADEIREEALALFEEQEQLEQIAMAHVRLATSKLHVGQIDAMEHHARIGLEMCRAVGNQRGAGLALWLLGSLSLINGEHDQAASEMQESLAILRNIEGAAEVGWVLGSYAAIAQQQGDHVEAKKYIYETLRTASGVLGLVTLMFGLTIFVNLLIDEGRNVLALEIYALLEKYPLFVTSPAWTLVLFDARRLAAVRAAVPAEVVAEAEARGRARDLQETAVEILTELEKVVA